MQKENRSISLTAAAFQDHLLKSYNLNSSTKIRTTKSLKANNKEKAQSHQTAKKVNNVHQKEYVLDASKNLQQLSLAEKLGIIEKPVSDKLSESQWLELKEACRKRNMLSEPCSICKEFFIHTKQQVLLSCSHSFHRKCIGSFEKFSGHKTCPICRFQDYETRVIFDGAIITSHKCATKIQSQWRRHIQEKKYRVIRESVPPKNERLRKEFYKKKLLNLCDQVSKNYDEHQQDVSQLIYTIDKNIASSRSVMKNLDVSVPNELEWETVQSDAVRRGFRECPICLSTLKQKRRQIVLLSCSHLFHAQCLTAYEDFSSSCNPSCPICRNVYSKKSTDQINQD